MIPAIWRAEVEATTEPGTPERDRALLDLDASRPRPRSGVIGAVGAIGGFLIPIAFSSPWVDSPLAATKGAFMVFTAYYVVCALVVTCGGLPAPHAAAPPAASTSDGPRV